MTRPRPRKFHALVFGVSALLVVALMLAPGMAAFSLWYDEVQVFRAADELHTFADLYRLEGFAARIVHPPLFFVVLKLWLIFTGSTDVALRALTVLGSLVTAAFVYRLTADMTRSPAGGFAAAATFGNLGLAVYFIHQTHNYSLLLTGAAMLLFFYHRWQRSARLGYAAGVVASEVLLLYTHYFSIYLLLALNLYTLVRHSARLRQWSVMQAVTALCYAPWLLVLYRILTGVYHDTEAAATAATSLPSSWIALAAIWENLLYDGWIVYTVCLAAGVLAALVRPAPSRRRVLEALGLLFGVGLGSLLLALLGNTVWQTLAVRRMIFLLVFVSVGIGYGLAHLPAVWRWVTLAALVVLTPNDNYPITMPGNWFFREPVAYIAQNAQPEDAVYINISGALDQEPFRHYATHLLPAGIPFHTPADDLRARTYTYLPRERIWVVWRPEDREAVGWWNAALQQKALREASRQEIGLWRVSLLTASTGRPAPPLAHDNPEALALPQTFDGQIELIRCAVDVLAASPGDSITVQLDWRATRHIEKEWRLFVHLIADDMTTLHGQADSPPNYLGEILPTTAWPVGATIYDQHVIQINPNTPPGDYNLRVGFYSPESNTRMRAAPGDETGSNDGVILARIHIGP